MAAEKYFSIGIGGTGRRCIEACPHLCARGLFDNKEIDYFYNILTINVINIKLSPIFYR